MSREPTSGKRLTVRELATIVAVVLMKLWGCSDNAERPTTTLTVRTVAAEAQPTTAQTVPPRAELQAERWRITAIEGLVKQAIAAQELPGCVIAVGDHEGVHYLRAFGHRAVQPVAEPMTEDTLFDLASLSKPLVVGTGIAQLADQGRMRTGDPVARYLTAFRRGHKQRVTVEDLLLHRSGLPKVTPLSEFDIGSKEDTVRRILATPLSGSRGTFVYSDTGYLVLGLLLEQVAEQPLEQYARDHIFARFGMTDTTYGPLTSDRRGRAAPTEERDGQFIRGEVHDPRAYRMGGVAGNAGVFSTATDLGRYAQGLLRAWRGEQGAPLSENAAHRLFEKRRSGTAVRTLGWDAMSGYSKPRGTWLSSAAVGHGGFTGTSLWIDPDRDLFVIFLSHRVHPDGAGRVTELVAAITDAAVKQLPEAQARRCLTNAGRTRSGLDRLIESGFAELSATNVALVTNAAAVAGDGRSGVSHFSAAQGLTLRAILTPEHGLSVKHEGAVQDGEHGAGRLPVYSLFGRQRRPTRAMLQGVDTLVFDLPDAGVRFFTYASTLREVLIAAREADKAVWVLDRPNPLGAAVVEGPMLDRGVRTFVQHHDLPIRHGMTTGELAQLLNDELGIHARLHVHWMDNYLRDFRFEHTGLPYVPPSPNLLSERSLRAYPAVGLLEGAAISVGRGTKTPFEQFGAPFLDAEAIVNGLRSRDLPGVRFEVTRFTPTERPFSGQVCEGVRLTVENPNTFRAVTTGLAIAAELMRYPQVTRADVNRMLGSRHTVERLGPGAAVTPSAEDVLALDRFMARRRKYLHYEFCAAEDRPDKTGTDLP